jgi:hypothetical protein
MWFFLEKSTKSDRNRTTEKSDMFLVNFLDRIFLKLLGYGGPYIEWRSGSDVHQNRI